MFEALSPEQRSHMDSIERGFLTAHAIDRFQEIWEIECQSARERAADIEEKYVHCVPRGDNSVIWGYSLRYDGQLYQVRLETYGWPRREYALDTGMRIAPHDGNTRIIGPWELPRLVECGEPVLSKLVIE